MKLSSYQLAALAILAGIGGWMITGELIQGGVANPDAETIAERESKRSSEAFRVRVTNVQPSDRVSVLNVKGRTRANAKVSVRAETSGTVEQRPVKKGQFVQVGELLCVIDQGVRKTNLTQAQAQLVQAQSDYEANEQLVERGFATKSRLRQLKSAMDAATASVANAEQELARTEVRASAEGVVQAPFAEVGDNLAPGGVCATLLQADPMMFIGQVSERDIGHLKLGMSAKISLTGGSNVVGEIRHIAQEADPQTRTFTIEVELDNADRQIRDGLTATALIELTPTSAYRIAASWLTLDDEGTIGVRTVNDEKTVQFYPVKILQQDTDGVWVSGLKPDLSVITLGQNYVGAGESVIPLTAEQMKLLEDAAKAAKANEAETSS